MNYPDPIALFTEIAIVRILETGLINGNGVIITIGPDFSIPLHRDDIIWVSPSNANPTTWVVRLLDDVAALHPFGDSPSGMVVSGVIIDWHYWPKDGDGFVREKG